MSSSAACHVSDDQSQALVLLTVTLHARLSIRIISVNAVVQQQVLCATMRVNKSRKAWHLAYFSANLAECHRTVQQGCCNGHHSYTTQAL